jgi:hypothetical protein
MLGVLALFYGLAAVFGLVVIRDLEPREPKGGKRVRKGDKHNVFICQAVGIHS